MSNTPRDDQHGLGRMVVLVHDGFGWTVQGRVLRSWEAARMQCFVWENIARCNRRIYRMRLHELLVELDGLLDTALARCAHNVIELEPWRGRRPRRP